MLQRLLLIILVFGLGNSAWGRSEFRLGGDDGISWQSLLTEGETTYVLVDKSGNTLSTLAVGISTEEVGIDTMIDYSGNRIQPVWIDPEENLSLSLEERKGHLNSSVSTGYSREAAKELQVMIDGDPETALLKRVELSPRLQGLNIGYVKNLVVNLGAELPINRIRFFPRPGFEENYMQWYEIGVADDTAPFVSFPGERAPGKRWYRDINRSLTSPNDPGFDILQRNEENLNIEVDLRFPTEDLHWIAIRPINAERDWEIAEFEIYGEGFVKRTSYTSPILDFGRAVAWSKVRWEGERPEGTEVILRTRTGNTPQPNNFWRVGSTGEFEPVSQADYDLAYGAGLFNQIRLVYDRENWGTWSPPYNFDAGLRDPAQPEAAWNDGVVLQSPSPTRYMQFQVVFRGNREVAPRIDNMTFLFAEEPAAQEVFGEIWPLETESFEPHSFSYVVRPLLGAGDKGFDRLEIFTQTRVQNVTSVKVDGEEMIGQFQPEIQDDRIVLSFVPLQAPQDNEKRIEVEFEAKVLRFGMEFTGWVYDSNEATLKQRIKPGNATFRFGGDVLAVRTPMSGDLISSVQLSTPVLTPNGDGANDQLEIFYDVRNVEDPTLVTAKIYDLSGRLVRQLDQSTTLSGSFALSWAGLDDQGVLVNPGIYLYQVELDADGGSIEASGVVSVAY